MVSSFNNFCLLQVEQACYGFFFATAVAASTYLYAKVGNTDRYQKISSLMQSCTLFGSFLRGVFSQLIVWFSGFREISLVYTSTGGGRVVKLIMNCLLL